ncbi:hypothetical protein K432DRAFT_435816 [Lepidopterella palustris CBS 459.81]|uniref:Vps72/YL1 C-terminal domain-containing protein n=1 Tax=Lepidopterella palustris CBS 459.81 TaxID=1314670 RepID=A0A8E2E7Q6_9PEZI|nr:hypothetical protein K432DRAFT_435816 [Lepidopterella palustris CBS 459.81]
MAPLTGTSDESTHLALLDQLDLYSRPKPFRNPHWKPPQRRNKNIKQILSDVSRKEASVMATQNNSGTSTPLLPHSSAPTGGATTPTNMLGGTGGVRPDIAQAAQSLSTLVLEKNFNISSSRGGGGGGLSGGPAATYTNIESAPSLNPSGKRHYCDVTGLPAPYTDPKTRLRYHNKEVFGVLRALGPGVAEGYLAARGAHTVLK